MSRPALALLSALALSGCAVQWHGSQAATSSAAVASTAGSNARIAFSSGQAVAPGTPGGQLSVTGAGGVLAMLAVGAVVADFLNALGGAGPAVKPLPPETRIAHTCSCYGYNPVSGAP